MKKTILFVFLAVVVAFGIFLAARSIVGGGKAADKKQPVQTSDDQRYETYRTDDFEIQYPYWPNIDEKELAAAKNIKLAVRNDGCNFLISASVVPQGQTFKDYTENSVREQTDKTKSTIVFKDIQEKTAHFIGESVIGGTTVRSVSYGYMTGKGQSYGITFIAAKDQFDSACQPFIDKSVGSVAVK